MEKDILTKHKRISGIEIALILGTALVAAGILMLVSVAYADMDPMVQGNIPAHSHLAA